MKATIDVPCVPILISAPLKAAPQGSKTLGRYGGLREASKRVKPYRDALKVYAKEAMRGKKPLTGPVAINVTFCFVQAQSNRDIYPIGRNIGDLDKLCRSTLDALTGIVYEDDSQVSVLSAQKYYMRKDEVEIQIHRFTDSVREIERGSHDRPIPTPRSRTHCD